MGLFGGKMGETSSSQTVSTKLERIAELARKAPTMVLTTLMHHVDLEWLREAYRRTRKDGATGVDGQTAEQYEQDLEGNLRRLLERVKSGTYRAPPVRRVYIPKGEGSEKRPIGIPTLEDKVLQRAVAMVLEAVYEQDFLDCSYGFRPGRSAHQALEELRNQLMEMHGGWVIEVDIRTFFDTVDHHQMREILGRRVRDGALLKLIGKWLNAGVMEGGEVSHPEAGTPQGGVISPLLANIYLSEVLDAWFEGEVKPRLRGRAFLIRYADDAVLVFSDQEDARRVMDVLPKRFGKYGLTLHPEKTRVVGFVRPPRDAASSPDGATPGSFDLLGFTHYWATSRKGNWVVKRKTAKDRFRRALKRVAEWCRQNRHEPIQKQQQKLAEKLRGHMAYFGITGNSEGVSRFREAVVEVWLKWLRRRSQRAGVTWDRFKEWMARFPLPPARLKRPYSPA
jgi:group II intron reverse transcriptase/maturase